MKDIKWFFDFSEFTKEQILTGLGVIIIGIIYFTLLMLIPA